MARRRAGGRRVALKVLGHSLDSSENRKRFLREGRLAAAIYHPNSVYVYGTEEIEGSPVIAMEIVEGGTLDELEKGRGPMPDTEAVEAMLQVIAGLEGAHAGGVLHRDIEPANCFIASDGAVKVGDFGLSVSTTAAEGFRRSPLRDGARHALIRVARTVPWRGARSAHGYLLSRRALY